MVSCKIDLFKYGLNNNKINIGAKLELKPKGPEFKGERNKIAQSSIPNLKKYLNMLIIVLLYAPKRIENGYPKIQIIQNLNLISNFLMFTISFVRNSKMKKVENGFCI